MQSYISVNLESSGRTETYKRKSKGSSLAHHRNGRLPRERFKYWLRKVITILFSQVGVGSLLVCYTVLGAMLFISIESTVDNRRLSQVASLRSSTVIQLWNVTRNYNVIYGIEWKQEVDQIVRRFQNGLVREIRLGYEGIDAREPWTFPQALMFSLSVYTTIGYGNLTPKTDWGKATTCLYAIFGIPLLLLYMANVGDLLATSFRQFYRTLNRCETRLNKIREVSKADRRQKRILPTQINEEDALNTKPANSNSNTAAPNAAISDFGACAAGDSDCAKIGHSEMNQDGKQIGRSQLDAHVTGSIQDGNECEANEVTIPISTCLCVFFCYILLGSILFSWWEGWNYFEGSYFCFVSLVTIGFSDMVPGQRSRTIGEVTTFVTTDTKSSGGISSAADYDDAIESNGGVGVGGNSGSSGGDGSSTINSPSNTVVVSGGGGTNASGSNGREESLDHVDGQLILCSIYILFGMALMAMCFHLTQERFFTTAKKLGRALHLI